MKIKSKKEYEEVSKKQEILKKAYNYKAVPVFFDYQLEEEGKIEEEEKQIKSDKEIKEEENKKRVIEYLTACREEKMEEEKNGIISLTQRELKTIINQVIKFISKDKKRETYTGALFKVDKDMLEVVALDGFRLAIRKLKLQNSYEKTEFIIPEKSLKEISKNCKDSENRVKLQVIDDDKISVKINDNNFIYELIQGEFLNYNSLLETEILTTIKTDRKDMLEALRRISAIDKDKINLEVLGNEFYLKASPEDEKYTGSEKLVATITGTDTTMLFNPKFLIDSLAGIKEKKITIAFGADNMPCLITSEENENFTYIILPLRKMEE